MDYRNSHLESAHARSYAESFRRYPYRRIVWEWERDVLVELTKNLVLEKTCPRYLDFACGTGRILGLLEDYMEESHGVDISEAMLNVAKENVHRSALYLCDLSKDDVFPERHFDFITAFRFFLNAQKELRESILSVFRRVIKEEGYLIINIHMNKGCLLEKELRIYQKAKRIRQQDFQSISVLETKKLLEDFHFNVVQTFHFGVLPVYRDEHRLFIDQISSVERIFSRIPALLPLSRYVIYVCRLQSCSQIQP